MLLFHLIVCMKCTQSLIQRTLYTHVRRGKNKKKNSFKDNVIASILVEIKYFNSQILTFFFLNFNFHFFFLSKQLVTSIVVKISIMDRQTMELNQIVLGLFIELNRCVGARCWDRDPSNIFRNIQFLFFLLQEIYSIIYGLRIQCYIIFFNR